jgi:hypothetical protein
VIWYKKGKEREKGQDIAASVGERWFTGPEKVRRIARHNENGMICLD